jgi:hypothetical protein
MLYCADVYQHHGTTCGAGRLLFSTDPAGEEPDFSGVRENSSCADVSVQQPERVEKQATDKTNR